MKSRIMLASIVLLFAGVGCLPESTSTQIRTLTETVTQLSASVDTVQEVVNDVAGTLEDANVISEEQAVEIDNANEEIDRVQTQLAAVTTAITEANYVEGDELGNLIRMARPTVAATASWNPYAAPILLGLSLLEGIVLLLVNRKKNKEAKKRQADKEGREKTLREIATMEKITAPTVKSLMYSNIGEARRAIL